ncbi:MAG: hypothetical protein IJY96_05300 [Oscillospiraceae bacterium]|nr:hypothetical protein [Oscillospiraceae bacterium]
MIDLRNPRQYCENFLRIRDKRSNVVPLHLNPAQEELYEIIREEHRAGRPVRIVLLKGRQMGFSTLIEALFFADSATTANANTLIMAHDEDSTGNLFEMNKLFYDELPEVIKPMRRASNARELIFGNPTRDPLEKSMRPGLRSRIRCVTAGSKGAGRGFTFRNVHGSEVAFWPKFKETHVAVMQTVPDDVDTCVIYETTANGLNEFKDFWDDAVAGRNGFRAVFMAWYKEPGYRRAVEPGTEWTDYEKEMMERIGLDEEQMSWRRWCIKTNCAGDEAMFRQEYPTTPEEAFLTTGRPFFDNERINLLLASAPEPEHIGFFEYEEAPDGKPLNPRWVEDRRNGFIRLWETPQRGVPYVVGGDTAGEGSDFFTAFGLDNVTGRQVCEYEKQDSNILYARQIWCLGEYFNWALLAVEMNFDSYVLVMLEQWGYPRLYQRQRYDHIRKEYVEAYGFRTDRNSRPLVLSNLRTATDETGECFLSRALLGQMLHFQYDKNGKAQATEGEHDDHVLAAAICHFARSQQSVKVEEEPEVKPVKLIDKLERNRKFRR